MTTGVRLSLFSCLLLSWQQLGHSRCDLTEDVKGRNVQRSYKARVSVVPVLEQCIRDPRSVHLAVERHCLFSQSLLRASNARLLTTTIVFGAVVLREASCLPVLWTEFPVWSKGGVDHLFISSLLEKESGKLSLCNVYAKIRNCY